MSEVGKYVIELFGIVFASQGFWEWFKSRRKTPRDMMMLAIGRDRLLFLCKRYRKNGYVPEDEFDVFVKMGEAYIEMGGNSTIKRLFEDCKKLPLKDE